MTNQTRSPRRTADADAGARLDTLGPNGVRRVLKQNRGSCPTKRHNNLGSRHHSMHHGEQLKSYIHGVGLVQRYVR